MPPSAQSVNLVEVRTGVEEVRASARHSMPADVDPWMSVVNSALPSTMAASTTCPRPEFRASSMRTDDPKSEEHRAAAVVADEVEGERRALADRPTLLARRRTRCS